jgi:hypothetical protein
MRVIFLDFDGVLNHRSTYKDHRFEGVRGLDPRNVKTFNILMRKAKEKFGELPSIVISSSWRVGRTLEELRGILKDAGFEYPEQVIDKTYVHTMEIRGVEILSWLEGHGPQEGVVVIDDNPSDMQTMRGRLIQTYKHIDRALKFLGQPIGQQKTPTVVEAPSSEAWKI